MTTITTPPASSFSLFAGRHDLPENQGAICSDFDFTTFSLFRTPLWDKAKKGDCDIIVTGLTPALTAFIADWVYFNSSIYHGTDSDNIYYSANLTLWHFDNATKQYRPQKLFAR